MIDWTTNRDQTRYFLFVIYFFNHKNLLLPISGYVAMTDLLQFFFEFSMNHTLLNGRKIATRCAVSYLLQNFQIKRTRCFQPRDTQQRQTCSIFFWLRRNNPWLIGPRALFYIGYTFFFNYKYLFLLISGFLADKFAPTILNMSICHPWLIGRIIANRRAFTYLLQIFWITRNCCFWPRALQQWQICSIFLLASYKPFAIDWTNNREQSRCFLFV